MFVCTDTSKIYIFLSTFPLLLSFLVIIISKFVTLKYEECLFYEVSVIFWYKNGMQYTIDITIQQNNTKFIYIVGDINSITLAMNSYLPT